MNFPLVLFMTVSLCISLNVNLADARMGDSRFARRHDVSGLILNVHAGKVRSLLDCGAHCRSSSCMVFCYNPTSALCRLSQPSDPIAQTYNVSGSKCYSPVGCPVTAGYAVYEGRCVKLHTVQKDYDDAGTTCRLDGGHLYHLKTLDWDLKPIVDLQAHEGIVQGFLWMGADDLVEFDQFRWSDSSPLAENSSVWDVGQPDFATQHCVLLHLTLRLHDAECGLSLRFVCQLDV